MRTVTVRPFSADCNRTVISTSLSSPDAARRLEEKRILVDRLLPISGRGSLAPWVTPNPDLALLLTVALQGDHPLFGPSPAEVMDPVPQGDVILAVVAGIPGLLEDLGWDMRNVVLTLARMWTTVVTGAIRSKDAAAEWALARLSQEHRPVLAHATPC